MNNKNKPRIFVFDGKDSWGFLKEKADYTIKTRIDNVSELENYDMIIFHKQILSDIPVFEIFGKTVSLDIPFLLFDYWQFRGVFDSWNLVSFPQYKKYLYISDGEEILEQIAKLSE